MAKGTGSFPVRLVFRKRNYIYIVVGVPQSGWISEGAQRSFPRGCPQRGPLDVAPTRRVPWCLFRVATPARDEGDSGLSGGRGLSVGHGTEPPKGALKQGRFRATALGHSVLELRAGRATAAKVRRSGRCRVAPPGLASMAFVVVAAVVIVVVKFYTVPK